MDFYVNRNCIEHWALGKKSDSHKYYARIETGKSWPSDKYRYFYSADEFKSYLNSIDGEKNKKVAYNKAEFYDTNKATDSYYDTQKKTTNRYVVDNNSKRKPTESERITANKIYTSKLTDNGRKTVDEQAKKYGYKKNSKLYFNLVNETYEKEKNSRYYAQQMTNIEKNRSANDAIAKRTSAAVKKSKSTGAKVKRKLRKVKNSMKSKISSITSKRKTNAESLVSDFANVYYVNANGEIIKRSKK